MQNVYDLALFALADLIVRGSECGATCHPEKQQDHEPDAEEDVEHGSVLALIAPLRIHGALQAGVSDGDEKEQHTDASHQGADDAQEVEEEVAHGQTPTGGTFATARICFILWRWRYEGYGLRGRMSGLGLLLGALGLGPLEVIADNLAGNACQQLELGCVLGGHIGVLLPRIDRLAANLELAC